MNMGRVLSELAPKQVNNALKRMTTDFDDDDDWNFSAEELDSLERDAFHKLSLLRLNSASTCSSSSSSSSSFSHQHRPPQSLPSTASNAFGSSISHQVPLPPQPPPLSPVGARVLPSSVDNPVERKLTVKFFLHATGNIAAKFSYDQTVVAFRKIPKVEWHAKERLWMFPVASLSSAEKVLYEVSGVNVEIENLDPLVHRAIAAVSVVPDIRDLYDRIPSSIETKLLPFQREGVRFILQHGGRALLADEMGLGKTIQAIAVASCIRDSWPVLILTPSSLRLQWASMIQQWMDIPPSDILVVLSQCGGSNRAGYTLVSSNSKGTIHLDGLFNIISYDIVPKLQNQLMASDFKVVIADESHFLKNAQAKRTTASLPVIKKAKYAILLSGTPALSRPIELFKQLEALYPDVYKNVHEYGKRYCQGGTFGVYQGASNHEELHNLMKATVMIRRLKNDVLYELPVKHRQQVFLDLAEKDMKPIYEFDTVPPPPRPPPLSPGARVLPSSVDAKVNHVERKLTVKFFLHATGNIAAKFCYDQTVVAAFRKIPKAAWHAKERLWMFPVASLSSAEKVLYEVSGVNVEIENLDPLVHRAISAVSVVPDIRGYKNQDMADIADQKPNVNAKMKKAKGGGGGGGGDGGGGGGKKKEVKKETGLGLTKKKDENFGEWYSEVVVHGEMIEYYDISGCYILRPWTMAIWEIMQAFFDAEIKKMKIKNCYFPLFVSPAVLEKEKDHIEGFAPEVAWVTKSGKSELEVPIAIRPTSETVMYPYYSKWIRGHRDLPLKLNQWCNVVRWEFSNPTPFIRSREFLWQEGHTAFATKEEADKEVLEILELYRRIYEDFLAIPVVKGKKSENEKFAGGLYTTSVEAFVPNTGRGVQGATSHCLGQNFAKMFDITFENEKGEKAMIWQNSWAYSTRTIGVMVMVHGDDKGLVLPPKVASVQAIVIPVPFKDADTQGIFDACLKTVEELTEAGLRVEADLRDNYSPGWKYSHWELKGVPLRIEIGPKDLEKKQVRLVRRDNSSKVDIPMVDLVKEVKDTLDKIQQNLFDVAKQKRDASIQVCRTWEEFTVALGEKKLILAPWCDEQAVEEDVKARTKGEIGAAKSLCSPFDQPELPEGTLCFASGKPATKWTYWGRSY